MKKIALLVATLALISAVNFASAQSWTEYPSPAAYTEAVYVSAENIYVFGVGTMYVADRPGANQSQIDWQAYALPPVELPVTDALYYAHNGQTFVLFSNGEVYQSPDYSSWSLALTGVLSMDQSINGVYFYRDASLDMWSPNGAWAGVPPAPGAEQIALSDEWTLFFGESILGYTDLYQMEAYNPIPPNYHHTVQMYLSDADATKDEEGITRYLIGGNVLGQAAFHYCQVNLACIVTHVLSPGNTNSVYIGTVPWAAGELYNEEGTDGFIINTEDFTSLFIAEDPITQITGEGDLTAAISTNGLFLNFSGTYTEISEGPDWVYETIERNFKVFPNPNNGDMTVVAEKSAPFRLYDLSGRLVFQQQLENGQHRVITGLAPGIYISGQAEKIIVR